MEKIFIEIRQRTCLLTVEDLGDRVPGFIVLRDSAGEETGEVEEYRAYTTYFRIETPNDWAPEGKLPVLEGYSQASAVLTEAASDSDAFRYSEDRAFLEGMFQALGLTEAEAVAALEAF